MEDPNSGVPVQPYIPKPGDFMFRDLNGDGVINSLDERAVGYPKYPEYTFGFTFSFRFRNFDFRTNWMGVAHVSRILKYQPFRMAFGYLGRGTFGTFKWQIEDAWKPGEGYNPDDPHPFPRLSSTVGRRYTQLDSNAWILNASYLRLKNVQIGYSISPSILKNLGLKKLRIYVSGYDLLTFSPMLKHYSIDPEHDVGAGTYDYPVMKIYTMGINITF